LRRGQQAGYRRHAPWGLVHRFRSSSLVKCERGGFW